MVRKIRWPRVFPAETFEVGDVWWAYRAELKGATEASSDRFVVAVTRAFVRRHDAIVDERDLEPLVVIAPEPQLRPINKSPTFIGAYRRT